MIIPNIHNIIDEIDGKFIPKKVDFYNDKWRKDIPSKAGWYLIKTNASVEVLQSIGPSKHKSHINIPKTIHNSSLLQDLGIAISNNDNNSYVIYNGEAKSLKARAREHQSGHARTACLGLAEYEMLRGFDWYFCYVVMSTIDNLPNDNKLLRIVVEQGWRAKHGWPILCSE